MSKRNRSQPSNRRPAPGNTYCLNSQKPTDKRTARIITQRNRLFLASSCTAASLILNSGRDLIYSSTASFASLSPIPFASRKSLMAFIFCPCDKAVTTGAGRSLPFSGIIGSPEFCVPTILTLARERRGSHLASSHSRWAPLVGLQCSADFVAQVSDPARRLILFNVSDKAPLPLLCRRPPVHAARRQHVARYQHPGLCAAAGTPAAQARPRSASGTRRGRRAVGVAVALCV